MKFFTKNIMLMFVCVCAVSSAAFGRGTLHINCGPMWGGKTTALITQLNQAELEGKRVLTLKHYWDDRKNNEKSVLWAHNNLERPARRMGEKIITEPEDILDVEDLLNVAGYYDVIGIDEIQFFSLRIVEIIERLLVCDKQVICSGLDLDFRCEPFGQTMPALMNMADKVTKYTAKCVCCNCSAPYTQRLINGQPASYNAPLILVGDKECYEPRCEKCHVCKKPE